MGIPLLKELYRGPEGVLLGNVETDGRFFIHSFLNVKATATYLKSCLKVLKELELQLKDRGFERYYTMADSQNGFRFNQMMGFKTNMEVWDDVYEIMVKEL